MNINETIAGLVQQKADLKAAINAKGGGITDEKLSEYSTFVDALEPAEYGNRVRFIDYDGTILKTQYVADGGQAIAPDIPVHAGLIFQGWNNDFSAVSGYLDVGAVYTTASGASEFTVLMNVVTGYTVTFAPYVVSGTLTIEWGDGNSTEITNTGKQTSSYTYSDYGTYTIRMSISDGGEWYPYQYFAGGNSSGNSYLIHAHLANVSQLVNYTFYKSTGLQTITMDNSMASIGDSCFYINTSLLACVFPDSISSIGTYSFYQCYALRTAVLSGSFTEIPTYTFCYCYTIDNVTIPEGVTKIDTYSFQDCRSLSDVHVPSSLKSFENYSFQNCYSLKSINFQDSEFTFLGEYSFRNCYSLTEAILPDTVDTLGSYCFTQCSQLRTISFPAAQSKAGSRMLENCYALESIDIPDGYTVIDEYAFRYCYRLQEVIIPESVTEIKNSQFSNCSGVHDYYLHQKTPPLLGGTNVFSGIGKQCTIWVPYDETGERKYLTAYKTATNWSEYADYMKEMES